MKEIIDQVWNASASAVLSTVNEIAFVSLVTTAIISVIGFVIGFVLWKQL